MASVAGIHRGPLELVAELETRVADLVDSGAVRDGRPELDGNLRRLVEGGEDCPYHRRPLDVLVVAT